MIYRSASNMNEYGEVKDEESVNHFILFSAIKYDCVKKIWDYV